MLTSITGSSCLKDPREAGIQAAKKASECKDLKMAFVYASVDYDLEKMLDGIKEVLPGIPLIGNTSFTGVVTPEGFAAGEDGFVGILGIGGDVNVGLVGLEKGDCARSTGKAAAEAAMKAANKDCAPDFFYMAAPPAEEEFFLKGVSEVIGRVPYFGGSAADNSISGDWKLYTGEGVFADGITVAFFYTDHKISNKYTGAYNETGDVGIITKIEGARTLVEIDGEPAVKKYASWRGLDPDSLMGGALLGETICSPLGVKDPLGDIVAIRHPMNGNDDYSMAIGSNLAVNTAVIRMEATVDELISSASETLKALKEKLSGEPAAYHLVHCGGRRAGIGDRMDEVVEAVKAEAGDVPFIMEFTFGEYGFEDDSRNTMGGLMLSYTAFCQ